jgi:hypothetical protein
MTNEIPEDRINCKVTDGLFVEPCQTLEEVINNPHPGFSSRKGVAVWRLFKREENGRVPSRTYFGIICEKYPNGFLFNNCPFCGVNISAPFMDKEEEEAA